MQIDVQQVKTMLLNNEIYNSLLANESVRSVLGYKYDYNTMLGNEQSIATTLGELVYAANENE